MSEFEGFYNQKFISPFVTPFSPSPVGTHDVSQWTDVLPAAWLEWSNIALQEHTITWLSTLRDESAQDESEYEEPSE